ncbi:MAG: hypothetical protein KBG28_00495 [Kofleriaceae bacterium]|jgi:dienelactone hydrolase|nr:hypothetical protein [Kofleriaceae bacterium]MBP9202427.1 hypothetical protein [Kofleriaceae bacterium]
MRLAAWLLLTLPATGITACGSSDPGTDVDAAPADPSVDAAPAVAPPVPTPTGTCPTLASGDVTFAPAGMAPRQVRLALDASAVGPGPLLLYWHATGSSTQEAAFALGADQASFTAAGGVVAAPTSDPTAGNFEWFIVNQSTRQDDFLLADEIVACLVAAGRVDARHLHSMGMSAGALQTTALSFVRSRYLASVATYSGGLPPGVGVPGADSSNRFAAMIFDGGASDTVFGVDFQAASAAYRANLDAAGHFTIGCDHGGGHSIPQDAAPSVLRFFADHAFATEPSPYAGGLPAGFPTYCAP